MVVGNSHQLMKHDRMITALALMHMCARSPHVPLPPNLMPQSRLSARRLWRSALLPAWETFNTIHLPEFENVPNHSWHRHTLSVHSHIPPTSQCLPRFFFSRTCRVVLRTHYYPACTNILFSSIWPHHEWTCHTGNVNPTRQADSMYLSFVCDTILGRPTVHHVGPNSRVLIRKFTRAVSGIQVTCTQPHYLGTYVPR